MSYLFVVVVTVAIVVAFVFQAQEPITGKLVELGKGGYDIVPLKAPAASSTLLEVLSYVFTKSRFGPYIVRHLLKDNGIRKLRELASQIDLPPLYYPVRRVNKEQLFAISEEESQASLHDVLEHGITLPNGEKVVHTRTVAEYAAAYKQGILPSDVMKKTIATIRAWEKEKFVIFSSMIEEDVLAQARASDERHRAGNPLSILDGVPIAFKDMMNIKGHMIYNGNDPSKQYADNHEFALSDDLTVQRFRAAGAIILGLTIMVEGGVTPLGYNAHFQGPVSAYSWNRYSGGSSSGSAVAVATGIVPISIGYDGGGSVRVPATMSGVHGLATTFGRIPYTNSTGSTVTKSGPFAATAADTAIAMSVMSPNDLTNHFSLMYDGGIHGPPHPILTGITDIEDLSDVRIGIYREWVDDAQPEIAQAAHAAIAWLQSRGATVVDITIPHLQLISLAHSTKIAAEFSQKWDLIYHTAPDSLEAVTRITIAIGAAVTDQEIMAGEKIRAWAFQYITELFAEHRLTAIVTPTIGAEVPILSEDVKKIGESNTALSVKIMKYASMVNFLGLPGYSVPIGFHTPTVLDEHETADKVKLPIGLQLIGDHWSEHKLLRLGHALDYGYSQPKFGNKPKPMYLHDPLA